MWAGVYNLAEENLPRYRWSLRVEPSLLKNSKKMFRWWRLINTHRDGVRERERERDRKEVWMNHNFNQVELKSISADVWDLKKAKLLKKAKSKSFFQKPLELFIGSEKNSVEKKLIDQLDVISLIFFSELALQSTSLGTPGATHTRNCAFIFHLYYFIPRYYWTRLTPLLLIPL